MNTEILSTSSINKKSLYPRKCDQCCKILKSKCSFYAHKKRCKGVDKIKYPRTCELCNRTYASISCFSRHKKTCKERLARINSENSGIEFTNYPRKCDICYKTYATDSTFDNHKRICKPRYEELNSLDIAGEFTTSSSKSHKTYFECFFSDCNRKFPRLKILSHHILIQHHVKSVEDITFDTVSMFQQWLELESMTTSMKFKKINGDHRSNNCNRQYYCCNFYKPGDGTPRRTNRRNKNVIPRHINCPVRISAKEIEGKVKITYFFIHNHESPENR